MHYAVHGHTAAELIVERANAEKEHMGLTTWENAPDGKIVKPDVSIAKNYLKQVELEDMGKLGAPDKPCGVGRADANPKLLLNDT